MIRRRQFKVWLGTSCLAVLSVLALPGSASAGDGWYEDPTDARAKLGSPWESVERSVPPLVDSCVAFRKDTGSFAFSFNQEEISSRYDLAKGLNVSASASVKALLGTASAKAEFVYDKQVRTGTSYSSFSAHALVRRASYMKGPGSTDQAASRGQVRLDSGRLLTEAFQAGEMPSLKNVSVDAGVIGLTEQAKGWLAQGEETFRRYCGDSFVWQIWEGIEIWGQMSVETANKTQQDEIKAAVTGTYANVEAHFAAVNKAVESTESKKMKAKFLRAGGSPKFDPTSYKELLEQARVLQPSAERGAPLVAFDLLIFPYTLFSECSTGPHKDNCPNATSSEDGYDRLAYYATSLQSIREEIELIKQQPDRYVLGRGATVELKPHPKSQQTDLRALKDELADELRRVKGAAKKCYDGVVDGCVPLNATDGGEFDPYAYWIRLPASYENYPDQREFELSDKALVSVIVRQRLDRPANTNRCQQNPDALGCLTETRIRDMAKKIAGYINSRSITAQCDQKKCKPHKYKNVKSGLCIDVRKKGKKDNTQVIAFDCKSRGDANQKFTGINESQQLSAWSGKKRKCVKRNENSKGTQLYIYQCNRSANEKWIYTTGGQLRGDGRCLSDAMRMVPCKQADDRLRWKRR